MAVEYNKTIVIRSDGVADRGREVADGGREELALFDWVDILKTSTGFWQPFSRDSSVCCLGQQFRRGQTSSRGQQFSRAQLPPAPRPYGPKKIHWNQYLSTVIAHEKNTELKIHWECVGSWLKKRFSMLLRLNQSTIWFQRTLEKELQFKCLFLFFSCGHATL